MYFGQISRNTFSDITAAIYEIVRDFNPQGYDFFARSTYGGIYFALSLKMRMLESILSKI